MLDAYARVLAALHSAAPLHAAELNEYSRDAACVCAIPVATGCYSGVSVICAALSGAARALVIKAAARFVICATPSALIEALALLVIHARCIGANCPAV